MSIKDLTQGAASCGIYYTHTSVQIKRLIVLHCDVIRWHRKVVFLERAGGKDAFLETVWWWW